MSRHNLEVADILRTHGSAWCQNNAGHISPSQLKVMSAIKHCRSAALDGHVLRCDNCARVQIAYITCRNRHCPKCQGRAARQWLEARQTDLLPVEYYHLVFTLPAPISAIAYYNNAVIYAILFRTAAETLQTIAADPRHLGARIGVTLVLHSWRSAMIHYATENPESNPHSTTAPIAPRATSRGFLPRGCSDACPLSYWVF